MALVPFSSGVILVALCGLVQYASSIFCYDCNSAFDPRCGEEFDPFSLGVVNCSLRDPPEHLNVSEASFCRSIKMDIYGKVRVVRTCGYLADAPAEASENQKACHRKSGMGDVFVTYCSCDTDLCNDATKNSLAATVLVLVAALVLLKIC